MVTVNGEKLKVVRQYKYLGCVEDRGMKGVKPLKERSEKMKMALGGYIGMIAAMRGVAAKRKVVIAKACVTMVGLYGLETSAETSGQQMEKMEFIQRNYPTRILGAMSQMK